MSTDLETWACPKCHYKVIIPWEELSPNNYANVLIGIREHRFSHLVDALTEATDEEIMALTGDEPNEREDPGAVEGEDAAYVLAGITELLKDDLPRARRDKDNG